MTLFSVSVYKNSLCNNFSGKGKMHFQKRHNIRKYISTFRILVLTNSCPSWNKITFLLSLVWILQSDLINPPDFDLLSFQFIFRSILLYQFTHNNQKVLVLLPNDAKFHWASFWMNLIALKILGGNEFITTAMRLAGNEYMKRKQEVYRIINKCIFKRKNIN